MRNSSTASRRTIAPARTRSRCRPGRACRGPSRHPRRSRSADHAIFRVIGSATCVDGGAARAKRAAAAAAARLQRRVGAGRHRLHERPEISFGGHRDQGLRRRDQRDAEEPRQRLLLPRHREVRQERLRRRDRRLRPGAAARPVGPRLSQQPRRCLRSQEGYRPRARRLQRGHQDQSQFDLRLQQSRRSLSAQGRLRPRRRRLRRGDAAAAEQPRRLERALLGARDQPRPDAAGAGGLQRSAQDQGRRGRRARHPRFHLSQARPERQRHQGL